MKLLSLLIMFLLSLNNFHLCDMSLEDDAFHSDVRLHIETWYFEAIFEDNESIVFMITSISNGSKGILMVGMHFYRDGKILYEGRKIFNSFFLSSKIPLIIADGKEMMRGYLNEKRKLCYNISFFDNGHGFQLLFENTTKGWRTNERKLWVAIPNMKVEGKIVMGKEKEVEGKGYHDHNIFFFLSPFISRGYFDGKIMMNNLSIVWAKLLKSRFSSKNFIVWSAEDYELISKNVSIVGKDYIIEHGKPIPTSFLISVNRKNFSLNVTLKAKAIHFIRLPFVYYWRYHVIAEGEAKIEDKKIVIESFDIMEYMLFNLV